MSRPLAVVSGLIGPLVGPECRRASRRGWLFPARVIAGLVAALMALAVLWWWWINWNEGADPDFSPYRTLRWALTLLVGLGAAIGLVLGPAVVAGGLSTEQDRGSMGLLLTTRVNALDIVAGRLAGRLSQVALVLLATVPPTLLLAFLAAIRPLPLLVMLLYGPALAIGAGGLAAGIAVVSRRGRDALIGTYAIGVALILIGSIGPRWVPAAGILAGFDPFGSIVPMAWAEDPSSALGTLARWLAIGAIGTSVAVVRLRPNSLRWVDGDSGTNRRRARRRGRVRPLGDRPMLWKEIFIERKGSMGGLGRWLGILAVAYLLLASTVLAARYLDALIRWSDLELAGNRLVALQEAIVDSAGLFGVFIQLAVGLRAAVAIASERERGTWDALLTSPLEGTEIVGGKLLGSLHALRWLFLATLFAWSLSLAVGAMGPGAYAHNLAWTVAIAAFTAAVGVRTSLGTATVPSAMAVTVGAWLAATVVLSALAGIVVGLGALVFLLLWLTADRLGMTTTPTPWFPIDGGTAFAVVQLLLFAAATAAVVVESRLRFDRLAGRIVPGDAWTEGMPAEVPATADAATPAPSVAPSLAREPVRPPTPGPSKVRP